MKAQYVCLVCGFNMIGFHPENCPFCNAGRDSFISSEESSRRFKVRETTVTERVSCLRSVPPLGLEHSAYRVDAGERSFWIYCPSSFDPDLEQVKSILFTHHHFLGASNLYREHFGARIYIQREDSLHEIVRPFTFDSTFEEDFSKDGIEAFHIDGHTPGFTFYIYEDTLFICDYVFIGDGNMRYNPYGPPDKTRAGGEALREIINGKAITTVCGFNYFMAFREWIKLFDALLEESIN